MFHVIDFVRYMLFEDKFEEFIFLDVTERMLIKQFHSTISVKDRTSQWSCFFFLFFSIFVFDSEYNFM